MKRDEARTALDAMRRTEALVKAHGIVRATGHTAVVYRRPLPIRYSDKEPPVQEYDYVAGSAYTSKPTKPIGLRLWMWISVTGLERLVGGDE